MKEAAITKSPYAYEPREALTKEEMIKIILSAVQRNDPSILSISRYVSE